MHEAETDERDIVQVSPPAGGDSLSVLDAYGRTVQAAEQDGTNWRTTSYEFDLAGNLRSMTDPAGNRSSTSVPQAMSVLVE